MLRRNSCVTATPMDAKAKEVRSHARKVRSGSKRRKKRQRGQPIGFSRDMQLSRLYARGRCDEVRYATYRERDGLLRHFLCSPIRGIETCEASSSSTTISKISKISPLLARPYLPSRRPRSAASKNHAGLRGGSHSSLSYRCTKLFSAGRCRFRRSLEGSDSPARFLFPSLPRRHCWRRHCGRSFSGGGSKRRDPWFLPVVKLSGLPPTFVISAAVFCFRFSLVIQHDGDARFSCRGKPTCMLGHFKLRNRERDRRVAMEIRKIEKHAQGCRPLSKS